MFRANMARVASVTILKDAASTAIYGSKAANRIVVIETKNPSEFLRSKGLTALILEPREAGYQVLDAVGLSPDSLTFQESDLKLGSLFS